MEKETKPVIKPEAKSDDDEIDDLLAMEKLDRDSPELWPEKVPGSKNFIDTPSIKDSPPYWSKGLTEEDINAMHQLGAYSANGIIQEVKKCYDQAYSLGVQEAKEMTRGKYLGVFDKSTAAPSSTKKKQST